MKDKDKEVLKQINEHLNTISYLNFNHTIEDLNETYIDLYDLNLSCQYQYPMIIIDSSTTITFSGYIETT